MEAFFVSLFEFVRAPHWKMLTAILIVVWGFFFVCNVWKSFWED